MPRFIAIPVARGDAFYLEREGFSVLTDGGGNQRDLPLKFRNATNAKDVNVVLCTHNDADHANGLRGFLKSNLKCGEVWLPGRWLGALPDILRPFVEVFDKLEDNIAKTHSPSKVETEESSLSTIEAYAEHLYSTSSDTLGIEEGPPVGEDGWPESYLQMLKNAESWKVPPHRLRNQAPSDWSFCSYRHYGQIGGTDVRLLWSAIKAADRIRDIAINAFGRKIPVRWFEFDTINPSGGVSELQPVNAREVARVRPRVGPLLDWLALTVSNKESLVFWSPPTEHHPGVLFTADSDLAGAKLPLKLDHAIATAPHHGSEANANAYRAVALANTHGTPSITWVRSDGKYLSRPGSTYLGLAPRRLCTLCRRTGGIWATKQAVRLYSQSGAWTQHKTNLVCSCQ
jgi:hypothetical protein